MSGEKREQVVEEASRDQGRPRRRSRAAAQGEAVVPGAQSDRRLELALAVGELQPDQRAEDTVQSDHRESEHSTV